MYRIRSIFVVLTYSENVVEYSGRQIILPRHAQEKVWQACKGLDKDTSCIKTFRIQLKVTETYDLNTCQRVCTRHVPCIIANGRGLRQHICRMVILPQVCSAVTSWNALHVEWIFSRVYFEMAIAHCSWNMHAATLAWREERDFPDINTTK